MYIMYVDETGDTGYKPGSTPYFGLSAIVVHESNWRDFVNTLVKFKKTMRKVYGLPIRSEIHAVEYIHHKVHNLTRNQRLAVLRNLLDELAKLLYISITNVIVAKSGKPLSYDIFDAAWKTLFQRFENTMLNGNFPGGHKNDHGIVITDATSGRN